jgi:hypothetical protein
VFTRSTLSVFVAGAVLFTASAVGESAPERTLDIHIDATSGTALDMRLEFHGVPTDRPFYVKKAANPEEYAHGEVRISNGDGQTLVAHVQGARTQVDNPTETLVVQYQVVPGGLGRHGHQGFLWKDGAGFDGRVIQWPRELPAMDKVRWHFTMPDGWVVASPMVETPDGWMLPNLGGANRTAAMHQTCMALGPYQVDTRTLGQTEFRVYTHKRFPDAAELAEKSHKVMGWFHHSQGFDPGRPWAQVWTPPGPKMAKVWSGASSNGSCYERPQKGLRNWQLLGHRLAHPMNEYMPEGFVIRDDRDHWFMEGWASYAEIEALIESGVEPDQGGWNRSFRAYQDAMLRHPDWARYPIGEEPASREELREHLHYGRGPMTVRMIADIVEGRTGKDFDVFMRQVFAEHKRFAKPLALRDELEDFAGVPLDDVWDALVDHPGPIVPTWAGFELELEEGGTAALKAGGTHWSGAQLHQILRAQRTESVSELGHRMQRAAQNRVELARRAIRLLPQNVEDKRIFFTAQDREALDRLEAEWPMMDHIAQPESGCMGPPDPVALPEYQALTSDGGRFLKVVNSEPMVRSSYGLSKMLLTVGDVDSTSPGSAHAFNADDRVRLSFVWMQHPADVAVEVLVGDDVVYRREVVLEPSWNRSWVTLRPSELGEHTGLLTLRAVSGNQIIGQTVAWRR